MQINMCDCWNSFKRYLGRRMTLAELRDKATAVLTPLWETVKDYEIAYYAANNTYLQIGIKKLHLPYSDRFDVWARVVADPTGFALQVLVELDGTQYAISKGYGQGITFNWRNVNIGTLGLDGEYESAPNTLKVTTGYSITF